MASGSKIDQITDQLRSRICSGQLRGGDVLVEDALAKEFALSRTPIRQVLHRLALEHFVETRTGVGTIVVPEDRFKFSNDLRAYRDLLNISAKRVGSDLSTDDRFELTGISSFVEQLAKSPSATGSWEYFYRMSGLVSHQLEHDLLAETSILLSSRIFRRLIVSLDGHLEKVAALIAEEYGRAQSAVTGAELLEARIATVRTLKKPFSDDVK